MCRVNDLPIACIALRGLANMGAVSFCPQCNGTGARVGNDGRIQGWIPIYPGQVAGASSLPDAANGRLTITSSSPVGYYWGDIGPEIPVSVGSTPTISPSDRRPQATPDPKNTTVWNVTGNISLAVAVGIQVQFTRNTTSGLTCLGAGPYVGSPGISAGLFTNGDMSKIDSIIPGLALSLEGGFGFGWQYTTNGQGSAHGPVLTTPGASLGVTYSKCGNF